MVAQQWCMQHILVLGGGFAGLWSAVGAARALDERGIGADKVEIPLVNATPYHSIRVRNYEPDLSGTIVPLADVLEPIGVRLVVADATGVDVASRSVTCNAAGRPLELQYDRLIFALGSRVRRPPVTGLAAHGFDIDTYDAAMRLGTHLERLAERPRST